MIGAGNDTPFLSKVVIIIIALVMGIGWFFGCLYQFVVGSFKFLFTDGSK